MITKNKRDLVYSLIEISIVRCEVILRIELPKSKLNLSKEVENLVEELSGLYMDYAINVEKFSDRKITLNPDKILEKAKTALTEGRRAFYEKSGEMKVKDVLNYMEKEVLKTMTEDESSARYIDLPDDEELFQKRSIKLSLLMMDYTQGLTAAIRSNPRNEEETLKEAIKKMVTGDFQGYRQVLEPWPWLTIGNICTRFPTVKGIWEDLKKIKRD